ncbi:MAG: TIGR00730 family Rossman fold protein [Actinomycetota bacterium]|nr:TIGR00730 family Rossman fold protein [Actinomycetota bacterium]
MASVQALCVFCGSSLPPDERFGDAARALGNELAERGVELVYGGGSVGMMGALADACLTAGGVVTGVIPLGLFRREVGHTGLTRLYEVGSMHERKQRMYDLADAFVAMPGGLGTLEELAEIATWSQLGLHRKPVVLLDVAGFWEPLVAQLDRMVAVGLLKRESRELLALAGSIGDVFERLDAYRPGQAHEWITADER